MARRQGERQESARQALRYGQWNDPPGMKQGEMKTCVRIPVYSSPCLKFYMPINLQHIPVLLSFTDEVPWHELVHRKAELNTRYFPSHCYLHVILVLRAKSRAAHERRTEGSKSVSSLTQQHSHFYSHDYSL